MISACRIVFFGAGRMEGWRCLSIADTDVNVMVGVL